MPARNEIVQAVRMRQAIDPPFFLDLQICTPSSLRWRLNSTAHLDPASLIFVYSPAEQGRSAGEVKDDAGANSFLGTRARRIPGRVRRLLWTSRATLASLALRAWATQQSSAQERRAHRAVQQ